jgi:hypothetical protein
MMISNLTVGWVGMAGGVISGALIGLFFQREDWMGGYASFRRRLARLGHIAFFGLGFLNILFALTTQGLVESTWLAIASWSLVVGAAAMPVCCFLSAWRKGFARLFPIPVTAVSIGIVALLLNIGEVLT